MIKKKKGVKERLSRKAEDAVTETALVYKELGALNLWITSIADGKHMEKSKHFDLPLANAFDIRIWNLLKAIGRIISKRLGPDYDVVFEGDHFHIEYDPKYKASDVILGL